MGNQMTTRVSNSELQSWKRCRRKWWLQYVRNLTRKLEQPSGALALGSRIHIALAAYYEDGENPVAVFDQVVAEDRQRYQELEIPPDLTEFEDDHQLGRTMLEGYIEWLAETGADADYEVIGAEQGVQFPLFDGEVIFRGKLDVRVRRKSDGRRSFMDHKTAASITEAVKNISMDEQMLGYMLIERLQDDESMWIESGLYNLLKKVKRTARAQPPFYHRVEAYHSDVELRNYWKRLHGMIIEIMRARTRLAAGEDPMVVCYPTPRRDCSWDCEFHGCELLDDGSHAEGWLDAYYTEHDPYRRYEEDVLR